MPLLTLALVSTLAGAPGAPAPVESPSVAERIARARQALDNLEYESAALELTLAASDPRATDTERVEANLLAGVAERVLGRDTDARLHFLYVLRRAPDTRLPDDVGPKILAFFELVREEVRGDSAPAAAPHGETPAPATTLAATPPAGGGLAAAPVLVSGGVLAAVIGAGLLVVGAQPWFAHAQARAAVAAAAASGEPAVDAADAQAAARADWEGWGVAVAVGGSIGVALGVAISGTGGVLWALEGT